jgi:23S rRNA (guanosine2251-2'-O)-methyltransferase
MSSRGRPPARRRGRRARARTVVAGKRAVAEAIRAGRVSEVRIAASARSTPGLRSVLDAAAEAGVAVREASRAELDSLAGSHQGVVAFVATAGARQLSEREMADWRFEDDAVVVVLDGVTDPHNLCAAARSAEAAGAAMLVSRVRRAAPVTPAAITSSAGALLHLPHARVANIGRAIDRLRATGFTVVGVDAAAPHDIYAEPPPPGRLAIVVGSEGAGMSRLVREACDVMLSIPMRGRIDSLNAAAAVTATLYGYVLPGRWPGGGPADGSGRGSGPGTPAD